MKLLMCLKCSDVFSLKVKQNRVCSCGETSGMYVDNINAVYSGYSLMLGFNNSSLTTQILTHHVQGDRSDGLGHRFEAFIIPDKAPSVKKVEPDDVNKYCDSIS